MRKIPAAARLKVANPGVWLGQIFQACPGERGARGWLPLAAVSGQPGRGVEIPGSEVCKRDGMHGSSIPGNLVEISLPVQTSHLDVPEDLPPAGAVFDLLEKGSVVKSRTGLFSGKNFSVDGFLAPKRAEDKNGSGFIGILKPGLLNGQEKTIHVYLHRL